MTWRQRRSRGDGGVVTAELVLVTPILIAFLCLVILVGRLVDARGDVIGAADQAARVASLQRTQGAAVAQAQSAAAASVSGEGLNCAGGGPQVGTEFVPSFQRGATVHITVTCTVNTSDLTYIGVPANITLEEEAWETIDLHRTL
jgi:Flp pilus assembly protein TadG